MKVTSNHNLIAIFAGVQLDGSMIEVTLAKPPDKSSNYGYGYGFRTERASYQPGPQFTGYPAVFEGHQISAYGPSPMFISGPVAG